MSSIGKFTVPEAILSGIAVGTKVPMNAIVTVSSVYVDPESGEKYCELEVQGADRDNRDRIRQITDSVVEPQTIKVGKQYLIAGQG